MMGVSAGTDVDRVAAWALANLPALVTEYTGVSLDERRGPYTAAHGPYRGPTPHRAPIAHIEPVVPDQADDGVPDSVETRATTV